MTTSINSSIKNRTNQQTNVDAKAEVSRGALIAMNAVGIIVGLWSLASLASAMYMVGGPFALAKAWFSAVAGF